jgi:hypothetical protein
MTSNSRNNVRLPEPPEGLVWEVRALSGSDTWQGPTHMVVLRDSNGSRVMYRQNIQRCTVPDWLWQMNFGRMDYTVNARNIAVTAKRVMDAYNADHRKKSRKERADSYVGTYPPKVLE